MSADDQFCVPHGDVSICYRTEGDPTGIPVLLIAGLSQDLTAWPRDIVDPLVAAGHHVIRFDNRDSGRSTRSATPPPAAWRKLLARPRSDAYDLADMAADTVALIDHLGLGPVHVVGMSMGGMIGQTIAARYPDRVLSLTTIISTTGARTVGQPAVATMLRMGRPPAKTLDQHVSRQWATATYLGSTAFVPNRTEEGEYARSVWSRGAGPKNHEGTSRQISAIQKSGDRTDELHAVRTPTLVVNGDHDPMVDPSGGAATAAAIPGARHVVIPGMAHHLAPALRLQLVDLVIEHVAAASAAARITDTTGESA